MKLFEINPFDEPKQGDKLKEIEQQLAAIEYLQTRNSKQQGYFYENGMLLFHDPDDPSDMTFLPSIFTTLNIGGDTFYVPEEYTSYVPRIKKVLEDSNQLAKKRRRLLDLRKRLG